MDYADILELLHDAERLLDKIFDRECIDIALKQYKFPNNIKNLVIEDVKIVIKLVDLIYNETIIKMDYMSCDEILQEFDFVINANTNKKSKYIRFRKEIIEWLISVNFFEKMCDSVNEPNSSTDDSIDVDNVYKRRVNQQEVYDLLVKNGLKTGIHCQATGCGKTYAIMEHLKFATGSVMLFTERKSVLSDLFGFHKSDVPDQQIISKLKSMGICDLTKFEIVNRITIKNKDWIKKLNESSKPVFLIINRAYLTSGDNYKKITKKCLSLVLHDECHNTSSDKCYDFLLHCKSCEIPIVGFSATPVRSQKKDKEKLLEIYSLENDPNKLNLLTNYSMMYAIEQNLILPPEFHWYNIESYNKIKKEDQNTNEITEKDIKSILGLLNDVATKLHRKKIIAWCGTIVLANKWKKLFEKNCCKYDNLKNFEFGIDTSEDDDSDYEKLKDSQGDMILFCATKHREGSDINFLDCCIFLDKVKNRGAVPFIQSIGRVLRICPLTPKKTKGIIIDCVANNENYDKEFVDKILGYYIALENLATIVGESENKYKKYVELMGKISFHKENNQIKFNIGKQTIKIKCSKLKWDNIITKFNEVLRTKCELDAKAELKANYEIDVRKNKDLKIMSDEHYQKMISKHGLTKSPELKYFALWTGWYQYLGIDTSMYPPDYNAWMNKCLRLKIYTERDYYRQCNKFNLPHMVNELYISHISFDSIKQKNGKRQ